MAMVDSGTKEFRELQDQDRLTVTNQAKEDIQPPIIEVSKDPNVLTDINWPPVIASEAGKRPTCESFNTTRPQIMPGQTSTLSWQVSNADRIRIEPGIGPVSALGSRAVKPSATTTYTLIAANKAGESRITRRVEVGEQTTVRSQVSEPPVISTEVIEPPVISSEVSEPPVISSSEVVEPVIISSEAGERPTCQSFNTTRSQIMPGQTFTLSWQVSNAQSIRIEPDIGPVSALGSRAVKPSATTTYTLIAANKAGESRITRRVEVGEQTTVQSQVSEPPAVIAEVIEPPVISSEVIEPVIISSEAGERPTCQSFNTTRPRIMPGQASTLSWQVSNAESIRIEPGIGPVSALGSRVVNPSTTTTYTLIAANKAGQSRLSCRIEISKRITIFSTDSIRPRILLEEDKASGDSKVLSGQKTQVSDPNSTLGKFIGYRARQDKTGKFVFIPVFENKQKE